MPGGLCRSEEVDGAPLDIGGGHFLDVRDQRVNEFMFQFMPEDEWNHFERDSKIFVHDQYIGHPFEANIWQMPQEEQVRFEQLHSDCVVQHTGDIKDDNPYGYPWRYEKSGDPNEYYALLQEKFGYPNPSNTLW